MRKSVRILSMLLIAMMLVGMMPLALFADDAADTDLQTQVQTLLAGASGFGVKNYIADGNATTSMSFHNNGGGNVTDNGDYSTIQPGILWTMKDGQIPFDGKSVVVTQYDIKAHAGLAGDAVFYGQGNGNSLTVKLDTLPVDEWVTVTGIFDISKAKIYVLLNGELVYWVKNPNLGSSPNVYVNATAGTYDLKEIINYAHKDTSVSPAASVAVDVVTDSSLEYFYMYTAGNVTIHLLDSFDTGAQETNDAGHTWSNGAVLTRNNATTKTAVITPKNVGTAGLSYISDRKVTASAKTFTVVQVDARALEATDAKLFDCIFQGNWGSVQPQISSTEWITYTAVFTSDGRIILYQDGLYVTESSNPTGTTINSYFQLSTGSIEVDNYIMYSTTEELDYLDYIYVKDGAEGDTYYENGVEAFAYVGNSIAMNETLNLNFFYTINSKLAKVVYTINGRDIEVSEFADTEYGKKATVAIAAAEVASDIVAVAKDSSDNVIMTFEAVTAFEVLAQYTEANGYTADAAALAAAVVDYCSASLPTGTRPWSRRRLCRGRTWAV